jgi:hypothetical protein
MKRREKRKKGTSSKGSNEMERRQRISTRMAMVMMKKTNGVSLAVRLQDKDKEIAQWTCRHCERQRLVLSCEEKAGDRLACQAFACNACGCD